MAFNLIDRFKENLRGWKTRLQPSGADSAYALALFSALQAFGAHVSILQLVAVYLGASAIAAVSPTPGGLGALEVGLVAGLSRIGVPASVAVAGVLGYRLITYWLPVVPGIVALRSLRSRTLV